MEDFHCEHVALALLLNQINFPKTPFSNQPMYNETKRTHLLLTQAICCPIRLQTALMDTHCALATLYYLLRVQAEFKSPLYISSSADILCSFISFVHHCVINAWLTQQHLNNAPLAIEGGVVEGSVHG